MEPSVLPPDTTQLPPNGHGKQITLSSNATLFWRIFVPVFGTVMVTGLLLAFWLIEENDLYLSFPVWWARLALLALWLGWLLALRRTLWRLKRVDANDTHLYVTNYWTTVRYPWTEVTHFEEKKHLGRKVVHFTLRAPGRFGQTISFLPGSDFGKWKQQNAQLEKP